MRKDFLFALYEVEEDQLKTENEASVAIEAIIENGSNYLLVLNELL
jgi:hypothetical protein